MTLNFFAALCLDTDRAAMPIFIGHLLCRKRMILFRFALVAVLATGCATEQAVSPPLPHAHRTENHRQKAAYNRPYQVNGKTYYPMVSAIGYKELGMASWYGPESGNRTAMGLEFRPDHLTAAHKTLPLPSRVRVTNLHNGRSVDVLVNDRGPFKKGRLIDLSPAAARRIGMRGLAKVRVEYIGYQIGGLD